MNSEKTLSFALFNYFPYGGLQRDFLKTAMACQKLGYSINVYTSQWQGERPEGFDIHIVEVSDSSNHQRMKNFQALILAVKKNNPEIPVIGFNKIDGLDVYFASDTCYREKAVTERGCFYRMTPRYKAYEQLEQAVFNTDSKTRLLILTEQQKKDFQKHYQTQEERFELLPPGINKNPYINDKPTLRSACRKELKLPESSTVMLLVASSFRTKGLDRAITAFAALPDSLKDNIQLLVVGGDKPDRFIKQAKKLNVADRITFTGARDDIAQIMLSADLLIHPAYTESAGMVLVEAIAAGLPILTTESCGYAYHVDQADAGIVVPEPYQQKQLNTALQMMLNSNSLKYWQQQALQYAAETDLYSLHDQAAQIIDQHYKQRHS